MKTSVRKFISLVMAFAISWLFIASLINFHMVHVFGKHNTLAQFTFLKPKSDKQKALYIIPQDYPGDSGHDMIAGSKSDADNIFRALQQCLPVFAKTEVSSINDLLLQDLRAPPFSV
ncbi:MAG: hypothetical protein RQ761_04510 [Bacteroidales bacterium]|nr:hypothetical protein [Bacteroidales bacterium]